MFLSSPRMKGKRNPINGLNISTIVKIWKPVGLEWTSSWVRMGSWFATVNMEILMTIFKMRHLRTVKIYWHVNALFCCYPYQSDEEERKIGQSKPCRIVQWKNFKAKWNWASSIEELENWNPEIRLYSSEFSNQLKSFNLDFKYETLSRCVEDNFMDV
jgi:hypothetical protein